MEQRMDIARVAPEPYRVMMVFDRYLGETETDRSLIDLVRLRMAQLDGCDYTREIWAKNYTSRTGDRRRLEELAGWRDSRLFSDRERAALDWAEALAEEARGAAPPALEGARERFTERELVDLTYAAELAHAWNRIILALGAPQRHAQAEGEAPGPSETEGQITFTTDELDVPH